MTKKFKVFHIEQDRYWDCDEVVINRDGEVLLIEERGTYQRYMYVEDISHKVRIEWES